MEFTINTHDLQKTLIALINSKVCCKSTILTDKDYDRLMDMFESMNKLCSAENDWTLSVSVNENRPRIIVEVEGGAVQAVYSDRKVDVDILDYDCYNDPICEKSDEEYYEDLMCEKSLLEKAW